MLVRRMLAVIFDIHNASNNFVSEVPRDAPVSFSTDDHGLLSGVTPVGCELVRDGAIGT
jgi:hypothetical protein